MRLSLPDIRLIELRSFLISFVGHLALASLIIFKFTPQPEALKPSLIFLGSLLGENDFHNLTAQRDPSGSDETQSAVKTRHYPHPFGLLQEVSKPAFSRNKPPQKKTFLKSTFLNPDEQTPVIDKGENLGIDLSFPERSPLKLDLK